MNKIVTLMSYCILVIICGSCSKDLEISITNSVECINGYTVTWRNNTTNEQKEAVKQILSNMIHVQGGYFCMGATPEQEKYARPNELPVQHVKLSDFVICKKEISDEQFMAILGNLTQNYRGELSISVDNIQTFVKVINDISGVNFALPTEAQWEYAARGGQLSEQFIYPGSNDLDEIWTDSYREGSAKPNELGIYNMGDLKSELCSDYYENFAQSPMWFDRCVLSGDKYVVRGGNYKCAISTDKYYPKNNHNSYYNLNYSKTVSEDRLDKMNCRISSRSYINESYNDFTFTYPYLGCRLIINE